ncbi:hypothetical protein HDV05_006953 [Chytridiales sp. JEL 0842]|nr:hypothetical protein HDV05_006953 [Chytridiales sp. JEL 0842]
MSPKPSIASLPLFQDLDIPDGPFSAEYPLGYPSWLDSTEQDIIDQETSAGDHPRHLRNRSSVMSILSAPPASTSKRPLSSISMSPSLLSFKTSATTVPPASVLTSFTPFNHSSTRIHPRSIKLISSIGDSLLTGLCLSSQPKTFKNRFISALSKIPWLPWLLSGEHRHNNCITGGASNVISIGRLIRHHSPDVVGLDRRKTGLLSHGSEFNFARSSATISTLGDQAKKLVNKLSEYEAKMPNREGWHMVFIWIGANDVLSTPEEANLIPTFKTNLLKTVQYLRSSIDKCFVCILTLPDISVLARHGNGKTRKHLRKMVEAVNETILSIQTDYDWSSGPNQFKLAVIPIPMDDLNESKLAGLISDIDGAHPSFQSHQFFAKCIWNNLFLLPKLHLRSFKDVALSEWRLPGTDDYFA